jgi:multidrug efflux pump subunit AcrB
MNNMRFLARGLLSSTSDSYIEVNARPEMLALYKVDHNALYQKLKAALNAWQVGVLHTGSHYVPMVIGQTPLPLNKILREVKIINRDQTEIPVSSLVTMRSNSTTKCFLAVREDLMCR